MPDRDVILDAFIADGRRRARILPAPPSPSASEHVKAMRELRGLADPCPFCGKPPRIGPAEPWRDGNAWGFVRCETASCPAQPDVRDGSDSADERGPAAYIALAIRRWNTRPDPA
jgi:hypothetical protein